MQRATHLGHTRVEGVKKNTAARSKMKSTKVRGDDGKYSARHGVNKRDLEYHAATGTAVVVLDSKFICDVAKWGYFLFVIFK